MTKTERNMFTPQETRDLLFRRIRIMTNLALTFVAAGVSTGAHIITKNPDALTLIGLSAFFGISNFFLQFDAYGSADRRYRGIYPAPEKNQEPQKPKVYKKPTRWGKGRNPKKHEGGRDRFG